MTYRRTDGIIVIQKSRLHKLNAHEDA